MSTAQDAYKVICKAFDEQGWKYKGDESKLEVITAFTGDDLRMPITLKIDDDRDLIRAFSILPFNFSSDKRLDGALATTIINWMLINGSFDYDINDGQCAYRMVNSYRGSLPTTDIVKYMVRCIVNTVDDYNDKLEAINKGTMTVKQLADDLNK